MGERLRSLVEEANRVLERASGADLWVVSFSGGKDSSVLLDLVVRFLMKRGGPEVAVVYSDTLLDWRPLREWALGVMGSLRILSERLDLPLKAFVLRPREGESFLEMVLERRYPAPSPRFRWCTERLKVKPTLRLIRSLRPGRNGVVMLTGIRYGESRERSGRMRARSRAAYDPRRKVRE